MSARGGGTAPRSGRPIALVVIAAVAGIAASATAASAQSRGQSGRADVTPGVAHPAARPGQRRARAGTEASSRDSEREADAKLAAGLDHYERRQFERAIEAFAAGYRASPRPEFLFALAQAERRSGDCRSALVYYRAFLDTGPSARQVEAARMHIEGCRVALASTPLIAGEDAGDGSRARGRGTAGAGRPGAGLPGSTPDADTDARDGASGAPWYRDSVAGGLMITGLAAGGAGVGFLSVSRTAAADAGTARTPSEHDAAAARSRRYRALAAGTLAVGSALVAGAIWRYVAHDDADAQAPLAVAPTAGGLALTIAGRF